MRTFGLLLAVLLLAAVGYIALLPDAARTRILQVSPVPREAGPGDVERPDSARLRGQMPATGMDVHAGSAASPARAGGADDPTARAAKPVVRPSGLVIPVQGVAASDLAPTFDDDRGEGRVHEALDIMAPAGTPVLAVADGHVEKLFDSDRGGITLYQFEPSGRYAYYYAHLQGYAPGITEGRALRQGEVIGYVGSTGNADPSAPHLHFAIFRLGPERRWWEGTAIDPWPLLATPAR